MDRRELGCALVSVALVLGGSLATGLLPAAATYQVLAGGAIVAGFALLLVCFSDRP